MTCDNAIKRIFHSIVTGLPKAFIMKVMKNSGNEFNIVSVLNINYISYLLDLYMFCHSFNK